MEGGALMATDVAMDRDAGRLSPVELQRVVGSLLAVAGAPGPFRLQPLQGGANNRLYGVWLDGKPRFAAKVYFRHARDACDRLAAEYGFVRFTAGRGVTALASPVAADEASGVALSEFVDGRRLEAGEIDEQAVAAALQFFAAVNRHRDDDEAAALPDAAEACFSIHDHLACVDRRVRQLAEFARDSVIDEQAAWFARQELAGRWTHVRGHVLARAREVGFDALAVLPQALRCLSPSDFGFHNALRDAEGRLRFIDFEYAGWDDPAKMVCDFFCQVSRPVPRGLFGDFVTGVAAALGQGDSQLAVRSRLLLPVYQVKWCCILLNEFLAPGRARRAFAAGGSDAVDAVAAEVRKGEQLTLARMALGRASELDFEAA
jgi:hypothetical protein